MNIANYIPTPSRVDVTFDGCHASIGAASSDQNAILTPEHRCDRFGAEDEASYQIAYALFKRPSQKALDLTRRSTSSCRRRLMSKSSRRVMEPNIIVTAR